MRSLRQARRDLMKKIVTIGEIVVEVMATEPGRGFLEPLALVGPFPSGAPAIFIDQVGRLGQPCGMIGRVGDDDFGRINTRRLAADGVDVSAIAVDPEAATGSAFVRYRDDGDRDFVFNIRHSANGGLALDAAGRALIAGADHLHVMGSSLFSPAVVAATEEAVAAIKGKGGTVSFDPNIRRELLALPGMRAALTALLAALRPVPAERARTAALRQLGRRACPRRAGALDRALPGQPRPAQRPPTTFRPV